MTRTRGFEIISKYRGTGIQLPKRSTEASAGYDIRANETVKIPSLLRISDTVNENLDEFSENCSDAWVKSLKEHDPSIFKPYRKRFAELIKQFSPLTKPVLVHTGIKAYFPKNEMLNIYNRSSNPIKRGLYLANGVGVIDSDYYNNESNEGELMAEFINLSLQDYNVQKGDRIMQGVFQPYLLADGDNATGKRKGGVGSTGK